MSEGTEPLAAILAEMRDGIHTGRADIIDAVNERLRSYADRIKAAVKRERVKARRDAEIEWTRIGYEERKAEERPGNAAALRAALEKFLDFSRRGLAFFTSYRYTEAENAEIEAAFDGAKAALAAPARNCDRFADPGKAWLAYKAECDKNETVPNMIGAISWLLEPAKKGGAE